jgi:hypothetical protein
MMPVRKNPFKLNKLQLRTLALAKVLALDPKTGHEDPVTGDIALMVLPQGHGNHVHVGEFTFSSKDVSGFSNAAVWAILERKGLAKAAGPMGISLTADALEYNTGIDEKFMIPSDH